MQKTIETIVNDYKELEGIGGLEIDKKDKRFKKAFDISIEELNELLKQYGLCAFQDEADNNKDNEYFIDKIENKKYINWIVNGKK